jgi:hypothetical protein
LLIAGLSLPSADIPCWCLHQGGDSLGQNKVGMWNSNVRNLSSVIISSWWVGVDLGRMSCVMRLCRPARRGAAERSLGDTYWHYLPWETNKSSPEEASPEGPCTRPFQPSHSHTKFLPLSNLGSRETFFSFQIRLYSEFLFPTKCSCMTLSFNHRFSKCFD